MHIHRQRYCTYWSTQFKAFKVFSFKNLRSIQGPLSTFYQCIVSKVVILPTVNISANPKFWTSVVTVMVNLLMHFNCTFDWLQLNSKIFLAFSFSNTNQGVLRVLKLKGVLRPVLKSILAQKPRQTLCIPVFIMMITDWLTIYETTYMWVIYTHFCAPVVFLYY